ncbi:phospho-acceptor domain-containing protein [Chitinophaga skermanii]|uniref:histidine kinase n=1 Tax=Chitinophaga skermanii TaxID=331697 RepID=A0A327QAG3_9BACT|nr:sensor histidine kinase [Chitinophaga skermanii]RAJ01626.1 phospho-acceptor domain-containing protein [Chitinophaga skermanii]
MHISVHRKIRIGFFVAFTILVAATICSYLIEQNLVANALHLNHTIQVSRKLEVITKQLKDAEAAIRGFDLTKDSTFLQPSMDERIKKINNEYKQLRTITRDNPSQQKNLDTLKVLLDIKYRQFKADHLKAPGQSAKISVNAGETYMTLIDRKVNDMVHIEEKITAEKSRLFHFFSSLWVPFIFIVSILAIFIGVYSYIVLTKEFRLQLYIEARMRNYQRELQENINLLHKYNQDLEQFAYVASHDLQEPLRKISTFSDRLIMKYGDNLPEDAQQLVNRMVAAVARMRILIQDLLVFSRSGRMTPDSMEQVDLGALLQEVLSDFEVSVEEKGIDITYTEMPTIEGSKSALQQLFQNLISNAIKFADPNRPLQVRISAETLTGQQTGIVKEELKDELFCRITVEDNGIGFEQAYAERIFLIFQRLHGVSEYQGTGIGLAICKKIISAHHGYISAYGYQGKGAVFVVMLPFKQTKDE